VKKSTKQKLETLIKDGRAEAQTLAACENDSAADAVKEDEHVTEQKQTFHLAMKPITEIDFSTEEERGQINMFENECEGMCGV